MFWKSKRELYLLEIALEDIHDEIEEIMSREVSLEDSVEQVMAQRDQKDKGILPLFAQRDKIIDHLISLSNNKLI